MLGHPFGTGARILGRTELGKLTSGTSASVVEVGENTAVAKVIEAVAGCAQECDDPETYVRKALAGLSELLGTELAIVLGSKGRIGPEFQGTKHALSSNDSFIVVGAEHSPQLQNALIALGNAAVFLMSRSAARTPGPIATPEPLEAAQLQIEKLEGKVARRSELLRRLFDLAPIGIILFDLDSGDVLEVNSALLSIVKTPQEQIIGHHIFDLIPLGSEDLRDKAHADLLTEGRFGPFEESLALNDGRSIPAIVRGLRFPTGDGRQIVWVLVEDVTEHRTHLAELAKARDDALSAREELDTAIAALPHGFLLFDKEDRIALSNPQMSSLFPRVKDKLNPGTPYSELMGAVFERGLIDDAVGNESGFYAEIVRARQLGPYDRFFRLRDGRVIHGIDRPTPTGGRVGLLIDVTSEFVAAQRLADVIDGSQAGTWEVEIGTGKNIVNERWAEMLGYRLAELGEITSGLWRSMIHPDDVERVLSVLQDLLDGKTEWYEQTYRMRHKLGHWVWINDRCRVSYKSQEGLPERMAGVHVDVSALKEAQMRLEQIIEGAQVGTWQYNTVLGVTEINERWAEMLGYDWHELAPLPVDRWRDLVHPDDLQTLLKRDRNDFSRGQPQFEDEIRLRHKDGHWVWVQSRGYVAEWGVDNEPLIMTGVHIDISQRKDLENALQAERNFLAQLMETSVSGIMAVDVDSRIVFANAEVASLLERPVEDLMGLVCDPLQFGFVYPNGQDVSFDSMPCQIAQRSGSIVRHERLHYRLPDGRIKVFSVNAAPIPERAHSARVVCTITDITASAENEARLQRETARAEAANRAKSEFLANMSHELRTPLNGVLGMAELLNDGTLPPREAEMVRTIQESGALLLSIVNDILDLAKIESGKLILEEMPVRLSDLVEKVHVMHILAARRKGIKLVTNVDPDLKEPVLADEKRLLQVMHNLLGNALKFTEKGSILLSVVPQGAGKVAISVTDTGIGMTDEQIARVFDEFTQADGTITRRFGGTGLGLPIVRRLVEQMQGQINLESSPGKGTRLTITLPMKKAFLEATATNAASQTVTQAPDKMPVLTAIRALVAEDNVTNQVILRAMLARLGMVATFVSDGDEAVQACEKGKFDILLLDISMPKKDGVTALAEIRQRAKGRPVPPAIAVTANAMIHHLQDYRDAGFAAVVAKPIRLDDLARAIATTVVQA